MKKTFVKNSSIPISVSNKRHNDICYHIVREAQSASVLHVLWIPGELNLADFLTNTTIPGNTRHDVFEPIFFNTSSPIDGIEKA